MIIPTITRPWIKARIRNPGKNDDFYGSSLWKSTKKVHFASVPWVIVKPINGVVYSNKYCFDCFTEGRINSNQIHVDHVVEIEDGGDKTEPTNLLSRCQKHHNRKTHNEKKKRINP